MAKQVAKNKSVSTRKQSSVAGKGSSDDLFADLRAHAKSIREAKAGRSRKNGANVDAYGFPTDRVLTDEELDAKCKAMEERQRAEATESAGGDDAAEVEHSEKEASIRRMEAKRQVTRQIEELALEAGLNVIDECGVICNLDALTVTELKAKLGHPTYNNETGRPQARTTLAALLHRRLKDREKADAEQGLDVETMTAKEYVAHVLRDCEEPNHASYWAFGPPELMKALEKMNQEVALVKGNSIKFAVTCLDPYSGRPTYKLYSKDGLNQLYDSIRIPAKLIEDAGFGKWKSGTHPISALWMAWPGRVELEGIGFYPGSDKHPPRVPKGYRNLWAGLEIEPKAGDWSLYRTHLRDNVCGGNDDHFNFLMDYLAHAVQKPQEKPGCAIVLKSTAEGSGKSMLLEFLRSIFGRHAFTASKADHLTGRFNGHLEEVIIFGVEEAIWAGNPAANSVLKDLITAEHIAVERKGMDTKTAPNYTRLIFSSNEDWVIPAGTHGRRYFVLEFEHEHANDKAYFDPIYDQMQHRGGIAAMLHELMNREIRSNLRNPPTTAGLLRQREHSLGGIDKFLKELATEAEIVSHGSESAHMLKLSGLPTEVPKRVVFELAGKFLDKYEARSLQTLLGMKLAALGVKSKERWRRESHNKTDRKVFEFPSLAEFRPAVSKMLGLPIAASAGEETEEEAAERAWGPYDRHSGVFSMKVEKEKRATRHRPTL
jgi:hypothetical protein